jgi:hypothetical protein
MLVPVVVLKELREKFSTVLVVIVTKIPTVRKCSPIKIPQRLFHIKAKGIPDNQKEWMDLEFIKMMKD